MPPRRRLVYSLILLVLLLALVEIVSCAAYRIAFSATASPGGLAAERAAIVGDPSGGRSGIALLPRFQADSDLPYKMHPYYGFIAVQDPYGGSVNEHGFASAEPALLHRSSERLIVGVAGGSVAYFGSHTGRAALERELRSVPELAGREVVVTTYAMGAYKQPQHLLVINDIIARGGSLDVLILIDGFNEAVLGININRRFRVDPFFPHYWFRLAEDMSTASDLRTLGRIEYLKSQRRRTAHRFSRLGARYSMLLSFVWKSLDSRLAGRIGEARQELEATASDGPLTPARLHQNDRVFFGSFPEYASVRDFYVDAAANWALSSALLDRLLEAQGGRFFHFLQPNQYFPGSKPLTEQETGLMLPAEHPQHWNLATGYPYFRAAGERLRQAGVSFHDLTHLFENHSETLYHDSCCHLNQRGNDLLMAAVGRIIAQAISADHGTAGARPSSEGGGPLPRFRDTDVFSPENLTRFAATNRLYDDGRERPW